MMIAVPLAEVCTGGTDSSPLKGISILAEREIYAIQARLEHFPAAVRAIVELSGAKHQSVDQIRVEDVERWDTRG